MSTSVILYEEIDLVCLGVLLIILVHVLSKREDNAAALRYRLVLFLGSLAIAADAIREIFIAQSSSPSMIILFSMVKGISTLALLVAWLAYVEQYVGVAVSRRMMVIQQLPCIAATLCFLLSPFGYGVYWAVEPGIYQRGPLFLAEPLSFASYGILQIMVMAHMSVQAVTPAMRHDYRMLACFGIFPTIGGLLQLHTGQQIPCLSPAIMMALVQGHLILSSREISIDALTGINRRSVLESYILSIVNDGSLNDPEKSYYYFMIDINSFKNINDTYGHQEGDRALQVTANALKKVFGRHGGCLVRYGGDEFAAVLSCSEEECAGIRREINASLGRMADETGLEYALTCAAGYERLHGGSTEEVLSCIKHADDIMYEEKKRMKEAEA